jgi:phosphatidylglycerol lysyltransferase
MTRLAGAPGFLRFLALFLLAILLGLASHVPGGIGVLDTFIASTHPQPHPLPGSPLVRAR